MERILRTRVVTGLVLAVVFGAGLVLGLAVDRSLMAEPQAEVADARAGNDSTAQSRRRPLYEQVEPTEEQKVRIDSIVDQYRSAMKSLHAEFRAAYNPRYEALVSGTRAAIRGVLTAEQAKTYDSLIADYERRRSERPSRDNRE
jgi:Spy/CpxP family protein refolding chaperone